MDAIAVDLIVQGDVFLTPEILPVGAKKLRHKILAKGESTGHAHVADAESELYEYEGTLYLIAETGVQVKHEEHKPINVPAGTWKIGIIREYDPFEEEIRQVKD